MELIRGISIPLSFSVRKNNSFWISISYSLKKLEKPQTHQDISGSVNRFTTRTWIWKIRSVPPFKPDFALAWAPGSERPSFV